MERDDTLDIIKGIGIFLVVMGHVSENNFISSFIYNFHMPLFFILSGYTYVKYSKKDIKHFSINRTKRLLLPYFIYGILTLSYWIFIERFLRNQMDIPILKPIINLFLATGMKDGYVYNAVLWFIPCMFLTQLIFNFMYIKLKNYVLYVSVCVISALFMIYGVYYYLHQDILIRLPWMIDVVGVTILFYGIGSLCAKNKNIFSDKIIIYIILFIILTAFTVVITLNNSANIGSLRYGNVLLFLLGAFFGSMGCCCLGSILKRVRWVSRILKFLGINSLTIMCIHEPLKRIIIVIFEKFVRFNNTTVRELPITIVIISIVTVIVCSVFVLVFNKTLDIFKSKK